VTRDKQVHIVEQIETWSNGIGAGGPSRTTDVKWLVVMGVSPYRQGRRGFQLQTQKQDYD
jgi:hypothetical protein